MPDRRSTYIPLPTSTADLRKQAYCEAISEDHPCLPRLRCLAFEGVPDCCRAVYWMLLLDFLPPDISQWDEVFKSYNEMYNSFLSEFCGDLEQPTPSTPPERKKLRRRINIDLPRTQPELHFFHSSDGEPPSHEETPDEPNLGPREKAMRRILYIYAILNPGIGYVQGMNEILAPLYYVVAKHMDDANEDPHQAEVGTFFLFCNVLGFLNCNFCREVDSSNLGIAGSMKNFNAILKICDRELWEDLEKKQLAPELYSFRWLTLLLSQEFTLPDTLRLWDCLFGDEHKFSFIFFLCVAVLEVQRHLIFKQPMHIVLANLQDLGCVIDVQKLISTARDLYRIHGHSIVHTMKT
eukprot:TRINITY_DN13381_c0_g1_i1.p1 TRINITY_DN13381_c0_g1~~TRINITY_DN13381_c0_g1_i1.p1  ORF type:complete len:351 (-),score=9.27 TRINITY_DN13381_c0_g1_i1:204-1256(-)